MKDKYIEECAIIQQNATYTADTHHVMAASAKRRALWFEVIPAIGATVTGTLVASGIADLSLLPVTIVSAAVSAIAAVLNPNKEYQEHLAAAKSFTGLKHDARFLREAKAAHLSDEAFSIAVENLHERYGELLKATPATDQKSFTKAQKAVQSGIHEPDRDLTGQVR